MKGRAKSGNTITFTGRRYLNNKVHNLYALWVKRPAKAVADVFVTDGCSVPAIIIIIPFFRRWSVYFYDCCTAHDRAYANAGAYSIYQSPLAIADYQLLYDCMTYAHKRGDRRAFLAARWFFRGVRWFGWIPYYRHWIANKLRGK